MKRFWFIVVLAVIGLKVYTGPQLEQQINAMAASEATVKNDDRNSKEHLFKEFAKAFDYSVCCDDAFQSPLNQFNATSRLVVRGIQQQAHYASKMQAKELIRYIQHQTAVGESSNQLCYSIGRTGEQSLYVYAIRHLLI